MTYFVVTELFTDKQDSSFQHQPGYERYTGLSGVLDLNIFPHEPLYFGQNLIQLTVENTPYYCTSRLNGEVFAPGSSIRGSVRTVAESISPALQAERPIKPSIGHEDSNCLFPLVEVLFGRIGRNTQISMVAFENFFPSTKVNTQIKIKTPSFPPQPQDGIKFYEYQSEETAPLVGEKTELIEVILPRTADDTGLQVPLKLAGRVSFRNLEDHYLGLLLLSLGLHPEHRFMVKLGGKKEQNCGACEFQLAGISMLNKNQKREEFPFGGLEQLIREKTEAFFALMKRLGLTIELQANLLLFQERLAMPK